jgi:hypothetical protein
LRVGEGNGLSLGRHEYDLLVDLDALLEAKQTRKHELSTVANGIDRAVLDNNTLVAHQQTLERGNNLAQVGLITGVVVKPLCVKNIVQCDQVLRLIHSSTSYTSKLLHVSTHTEQETEMHAKCTDVGSSLAAHPEDTELPLIVELVQLALVDCSDTQLTLDSRNERWPLEQSTSEGLEGARKLCLATRQLVVQTNDTHVLLSGTLLGLYETGGAINADDETASDLGIKGTAVASLLNSVTISA